MTRRSVVVSVFLYFVSHLSIINVYIYTFFFFLSLRTSAMNTLFMAFSMNSFFDISPSLSTSMVALSREHIYIFIHISSLSHLTSITQDASRSGSSSIPANLNIQMTISLISLRSMDPPLSASKAMKIQLSFSSTVDMFFTLVAWYHSKKFRVPLRSSSKTRNRASFKTYS